MSRCCIVSTLAVGAQTTLNIWKPAVQSSSEFSLSQLWLTDSSLTQTLEVGYNVYPDLYNGDNNPHIFVFSLSNGNGCYNTTCGDFVKTSNVLNIGGAVPFSTLGNSQVQIETTVAFWRDPATGNWILFSVDAAGNYIQSGYYKKSKFGTGQLTQYATFIEFGGEIAAAR